MSQRKAEDQKCPTCGAEPRQPCTNPSGAEVPFHGARTASVIPEPPPTEAEKAYG